jgi:iron complex outermembrane recepter protein
VFDRQTREAIPGATVFKPGSTIATCTDYNGRFELVCPCGTDSLEVRMLGYESCCCKPGGDQNIGLVPQCTIMDEVVVTAGREAQARSEAPMAIEKISQSTINETKPTLLAELINKVPGVIMLNLNNEQHGMSIRQPMGTSPYYLYMEDGIPLRTMGIFNHNALIEMNLMAVSAVEVVKGPASSLYGPEAVGGAVNFITQKPTALATVKAGLQADNYGYKRFQWSASGRARRKLGYFLGGYYAGQKDGWMSYSNYNKNNINVRLDYDLSQKTKLVFSGAYIDYYSQTPGSVDSIAFYQRSYVSSSPFTYRKVNAKRARLTAEHSWNQNNQTILHLFCRDNTISQNPAYAIRWARGSTVAKGEINDNSFTNRGVIAQHSAKLPTLRSKLLMGASLDLAPVSYQAHMTELSARLRPGGASVEEFQMIGEHPEILLSNYEAIIYNSAVFTQIEFKPVKALGITAGLRHDNMSFSYVNHLDGVSGIKSFEKLTPRVGTTLKVHKNLAWYANYSRGFSPPALTTVFTKRSPGSSDEFYYNLQPAEFDSYETGVWSEFFKNKLSLNLTVYEMWGKNELLNVRQPDNSTEYQSAGKTMHRGIEYSATLKPDKHWMLRAGGSISIHRYEEFVLSSNDKNPLNDVNGKRMPSAPTFVCNSEVIYKPGYVRGLRLALEWQYMNSWFQNQVNTVKYSDKGAFGLSGISVLNFRSGYEWKGCEVFVNVLNLTNELYAFNATRGNLPNSTSTFTPAPPRVITLGFQYAFTGNK